MNRLSMSVRAVVARAMARKKKAVQNRTRSVSSLIEALEPRMMLSASPFTTSNFTPLGGDSVIIAGPGGVQGEPRLDLNGDGQADLIVQYENRLRGGPVTGHDVAALLTNAQGPMTEVTILHLTSPASPIQSIATDVNNDGRIDVVVYHSDGAFNAHRFLDVFVGQPDGTFTVGQSIDLGVGLADSKLTVFDMTGDGFADLHLRDASKVTVYRGVGNGTFASPVVSNFPTGLVTGIDFQHDMTGDGIADMVISVDNFIQQTLGVYRGLATGGYNTGSPTYLNTTDNLTLSAVLQLTNDTAPEIVAYSAASFAPLGAPVTVRVYRNNGTGGFAQSFATTSLANGFYSQNIGGVPIKPLLSPDLDGDGDLDLILLEGSGLTSDLVVRVLRNNGNAAFSAMAAINVSDFLSLSNVFTADVDNDGFLDIFVQRHNLAKGWYGTTYFNNGDDSFSGVGATVLPTQQVGSVAPVLVDLNSDGRLDVLLASSFPASIEGSLYNGGRTFRPPFVTAGIGGNVTLNPVPRDLNGDGLPDIIAYRSNGPSANAAGFTVYTGNGNAGFTMAQPTVINAHDVNNNILPTLGDINGDGRPDLIFTGEQATTDNFSGIYVVLNNALPPTDTAGTNAAEALDLGTIIAPLSLVEYVSPDLGADPRDRFDFFKFTLDAARKVRFTVTPEVTSVYMSILPESGIGGLGSVFPSSGLPGFLDLDMQPGTYLINANKGGGAGSRYRLDIEFPDVPAAIGVFNGLDAIQSGQIAAVNYGTVARTATDTTNNTEFLVRNTGSTPLNLASLILPSGFVLGRDPLVTTLAPGASDTFTVNLDTSELGTFSGNIIVRSSDGGAPDFLIPVTGTVVLSVEPQFPEITVHLGQVNLIDGQAAAIAFGTVALGDPTVVRTFTVTNDGAAPLTLGVPQLPAGFTLTEPLAALLEPGASDTFTVSMPTTVVGSFNGQIIITNNDADENPFNFPITGAVQEGTPPPSVSTFLSVRGNNVLIAANDDTPSVIDATDFGSTSQGTPVIHTFTMTNESAGKLTINSVVVPDGFKLLKKAPKSLAPGKSAVLTVALTGRNVGTSAGDLIITTGDGNAAPMNFRISGVVADNDNTQDLGPIIKKGTASGLIGGGDASDTVTFSLAARSKVTLGLKGKKTDLDLFVLNNLGTLLGQSINLGTKSEKLSLELDAGTYTLRIVSVDDSVSAWAASISSKAVS